MEREELRKMQPKVAEQMDNIRDMFSNVERARDYLRWYVTSSPYSRELHKAHTKNAVDALGLMDMSGQYLLSVRTFATNEQRNEIDYYLEKRKRFICDLWLLRARLWKKRLCFDTRHFLCRA